LINPDILYLLIVIPTQSIAKLAHTVKVKRNAAVATSAGDDSDKQSYLYICRE
jgi:hypothetical protein